MIVFKNWESSVLQNHSFLANVWVKYHKAEVIRCTGGSLLDMPKFPWKSEALTSNIYLRSSLLPPAAAAEPELGLNKVDTGEGGDIWVR